MKFELRFPQSQIRHWAVTNSADLSDLIAIGKGASKRGYLKRDEFLHICERKSNRTKSRCASNSKALVEEVTRISFAAKSEEVRIQVLTVLNGVAWPTASYILHFYAKQQYPVLDVRALWSLKTKVPTPFTFAFWSAYTAYCRRLARASGVTLRILDRALWKYSEDNQ